MELTINIILLLAGIIILVWGANKFVDHASVIAKHLGVGELVIGLTLIAAGTSAPEVFVGISAVLNGNEDIALGTAIGSNISNIALIFGVACIGREIYPKKNITSKRQYVPLIGSAILLGISLIDLVISPLEGLIILFVLPAFIYTIYSDRSIGVSPPEENNNKQKSTNYFWTLSILAISFVALYYGSEGVVVAGKGMGEVFGISQITIGLVVIAIGTSLPELAVTISAILKNRTDVVVGNVIGSNVLNIALVVPVIGFFGNQGSLDPFLFKRDYFVMLLITIFFAVFVFLQSKRKIFKGVGIINASGYIFVLVYILYILNLSKIL